MAVHKGGKKRPHDADKYYKTSLFVRNIQGDLVLIGYQEWSLPEGAGDVQTVVTLTQVEENLERAFVKYKTEEISKFNPYKNIFPINKMEEEENLPESSEGLEEDFEDPNEDDDEMTIE